MRSIFRILTQDGKRISLSVTELHQRLPFRVFPHLYLFPKDNWVSSLRLCYFCKLERDGLRHCGDTGGLGGRKKVWDDQTLFQQKRLKFLPGFWSVSLPIVLSPYTCFFFLKFLLLLLTELSRAQYEAQ